MVGHARPTHVLVECPELIPSVKVGVLDILQFIQSKGALDVRFARTLDITAQEISWCDILVTVRGCEYLSKRVVSTAKKFGRYVIYFLDDDLLDVPVYQESEHYFREHCIRRYLSEIMGLCDVLWVVNRRLGEKYSQLNKIPFITSRVPVQLLPVKERNPGPFRILYAGATDHSKLVRHYLSPAIRDLGKEFGKQVSFTLIGVDSGIKRQPNLVQVPYFASYQKYIEFVENGSFDIGLAPIHPEPFFGFKYYNKFIEYTKVGAVGVYTNAPPYTEIVRDGENGLLCGFLPEAWTEAIRKAVTHPHMIRDYLDMARETLKKEFTFTSVADELVGNIPQLMTFRSQKKVTFHKTCPKALHYLNRAHTHWKAGGIKSVGTILRKATKVFFNHDAGDKHVS